MNHLNMNMNGLNGVNGAGGVMPVMNHATNGVGSRPGNDQDRDNDYEAKMNTYIYDYFLKHQQYECARALLNSGLKVNTVHSKSSPGRNRDMNGVDENSMDSDSKDNINSKKPEDLPNPDIGGLNPHTSFLLEWFSLFWDMFLAQRKAPQASMHATQYVQFTQQQSRLRQEQQQRFLQHPGMMPGNMQNYQNLLRMQQGGMAMNPNELRQRASQNNLRNVTPQQMQMARSQQQQMLQQNMMQRDGSDGDMNGPRPRTPSSGENAPSPSKRPRLDGPPFNQQQMQMPNGRPAQGMQGPQMMAPNTAQANKMLINAGIHPGLLSQSQLESFHSQQPHVQHKSIQVYAQNMAQQTRQNMPQAGMLNQGSPMMQSGLDVGAGIPDLYAANAAGQMRGLGPMPQGPGATGNHALQDYQMQLMLLEQQNKKRLLMAKQEQENGQPMAGQPGFVPGMSSPQDGRPGPSPNPSDQMKQRGTPKMVSTGLPGSPMPDGSMPQTRGSPAAMNFNQMPPDMFQTMKGMQDGMGGVGPNVNGMRPPSSHPQYNGVQFNPGMEAMARAQAAQNGGRAPNNWQQGPPGQAPMMSQPPQAQQPSQMGTPQQRNTTMPPPQAPPTASATNGRPASPLQAPAPPTPGQQNKQNPKGGAKKERKDRAKPTKKGSIAAATPSSEAENPPPTPTPPTPITSQHPDSFKSGKNANGQNQGGNIQAAASISGPSAPLQPPQPDMNGLHQFNGMDSIDPTLDMTFGLQDGGDVLEQFDFDSFLQDSEHGFDLGDASMAFGNFDTVEATAGDA